jgi:hypothetical protein
VRRTLQILAACLALLSQGPVLADAGDPLNDRVSIGVGTFLLSTSTRVRVDGTARNGTVIDADEDLGLQDADRFRIDAYWRFRKRHKIRMMYFDTSQSEERTIQRDIQFGDTTYPLDATLEAKMQTQVAEIAYEYSFLRRDTYEVTGSIGIHNLSFELGLSASESGSGQTLELDRSVDANGPLPVIGLRGIWRINDDWYVDGQAQFFRISMDPYGGRIGDYSASLVWMPWKHFGIGAGYNQFVTRVDVSSATFNGDLRWTYGGARVFITASF